MDVDGDGRVEVVVAELDVELDEEELKGIDDEAEDEDELGDEADDEELEEVLGNGIEMVGRVGMGDLLAGELDDELDEGAGVWGTLVDALGVELRVEFGDALDEELEDALGVELDEGIGSGIVG